MTGVRIAAVGDVHVGDHTDLFESWKGIEDQADLLLLAGDLTRCGAAPEAALLADVVSEVQVPVVAVLGNHDVHAGDQDKVVSLLGDAGVSMLVPGSSVVDVGRMKVGVAGTKGFGCGFPGASCSEFGEPEMKAFVQLARAEADHLRAGLEEVHGEGCDVVVALTHYAPCIDTLIGEPEGIWPFLGAYQLGEAIDTAGAHIAIHGHAHRGAPRGRTCGGVPVRNVARTVIEAPYAVFCLEP